MTNSTAAAPVVHKEGSELVSLMAKAQHIDANMYAQTVMRSCFDIKDANKNPIDPTRAQFMAFLMIAREHDLNPITREIYAFEKAGKITPIVSIDGWLKIINSHPEFDGMEFEDHMDDDGKLLAITCRMFRSRGGRESKPTQLTEYLSECKRDTQPWNKWPIRMLRHKATIQCARYAFGFSGIVDADEAERIKESGSIEGVATVVEDAPVSPVQRLVSKVQERVTENDLAPETENPAPVEAEKDIVEGESMSIKDTDGHNPEAEETITADGEIIPGIKKGSEIKKPARKKKPQDQTTEEFQKDLE